MEKEDRQMLIETHTLVGEMHKSLGGIRKTLYGNGRPGLVTRVERAEGAARFFVGTITIGGIIFGILKGVGL